MVQPAIPIRNLYYLFLYAWDRFEEAEALGVGADSSPDVPNLLAKVLLAGTRTVLRRGLDRGYQHCQDDIATVRGRISLNDTIMLKARNAARLSCVFDELSHDVPQNRIVKSTLVKLARCRGVDRELAHDLQLMARRSFADVSDVYVRRADFDRLRLHRNNAYYDLLLKVCRLAHDLLLPEHDGDRFGFQDVLRDEQKMALIFEQFVRNFYAAEQTQFRVSRPQLAWDAVALTQSSGPRLPTMQTDIYLESADRRIIIDTKYYSDALQYNQYGSPSYRSENLYQLFAYLRNDASRTPGIPVAEGMLLYPQTGLELDGLFQVHGHTVRLATVDLAQPWALIDARLKALIEMSPPALAELN